MIGKKHNKISQAHNEEKIVDLIRQVSTMWERVQETGGKRKKASMADAFRLNCIEFGDADMKATKFGVYFNFATLFSPQFLKKLETATIESGVDLIPFNSLEHLVKLLKNPEMKGRPLLSQQLQLYSLQFFQRYWKRHGKQLNSEIYKNTVMNYLVMILTMKQTAHGLLPEDVQMNSTNPDDAWCLPDELQDFFAEHLDRLPMTEAGFQYAHEYFETHRGPWGESKGYVPAEVKKYFVAATNQQIKRKGELSPLSEPDDLKTPKKLKAASVQNEQQQTPLLPVRRSERVTATLRPQPESEEIEESDLEVDGESQEEDVLEQSHSSRDSRDGDSAATESATEDTEEQTFEVDDATGAETEQRDVWSVPTAEDLATCDSIWVSGSIEFDKPLEDLAEYLSKRKEWVQLVPEPFKTTFPDNNFPQQCAFICVDARSYANHLLTDEDVRRYPARCTLLVCFLYFCSYLLFY